MMNVSDRQFEIFFHSVIRAGKEKCGDSFIVREFKKENLILLAVADGVSSCPCDWLASKMACETVVWEFEKARGSLFHRMRFAAGQANSALKSVNNSCKGMLTSLTLVVWQIETDQVYYLNVGDSRLYIGTENNLKQITKDDIISVLMKRNGEVILNAGMPVFKRGVTRSLGQAEHLDFDVQKTEFTSKDLLILVSDGICKNENFTSDLKDIFVSENFSDKLKQLVRNNSEKNEDDATLVLLWRTNEDKESRSVYDECISRQIDFREKDLSGKCVIGFLQNDLIEEIAKDSNDKAQELLDYSNKYRLKFSRTFLSKFLSLVIKQGTDRQLIFRLRELIRAD